MDAALKKMFTLRQIRDLGLAALKDSCFGDRDVLEAAGTFANRLLSRVEPRYKAASELRHLGGVSARVKGIREPRLLQCSRIHVKQSWPRKADHLPNG
jgi:hypothetical protein